MKGYMHKSEKYLMDEFIVNTLKRLNAGVQNIENAFKKQFSHLEGDPADFNQLAYAEEGLTEDPIESPQTGDGYFSAESEEAV